MTAVQLRYSIMARWTEELFPLLEERGIGAVAYSPIPIYKIYNIKIKLLTKNKVYGKILKKTEYGMVSLETHIF